jgi:arsenate reductase
LSNAPAVSDALLILATNHPLATQSDPRRVHHPLKSLHHDNPERKATRTFTAMITIYHNPRCTKSRATYDLIRNTYNSANETTEVIEYLKQPLTVEQLKALNAQLGGGPVRAMIRETEAEYAELQLADPTLTDAQLYEALAKHPVLLQRPIVVRNGRAVIGRPPENVAALFL